MANSDIELASIHHEDANDNASLPRESLRASESNNSEHGVQDTHDDLLQRVNETSLPPVDKGFGPWSFLCAAFIVETLVWGFPTAYGVFLLKYMQDPFWSSQPQASFLLPLIGPLSSGIIYCTGPITYPLTARYPRHRRKALLLGSALMFASLFGASYARTIISLVVLQGALYAIGGALLYAPAIYYMSEWFVVRRGLANGAINAGTALGGLLLPLILPPLINKYDIPKTLRILSITQGALLLLALPFIRGRLPENQAHSSSARAHPSPNAPRPYMKNKSFWIIILATLIQGLAYFIPILWLPAYASSLRLSPSSSSLSLAFLNGASVVGRLSLGILSDRFSPWLLASTTLLLTAFAVFVLWGVLSYTFAGIVAYSIVYGCLAGGYSSLWTGFVRPIAKDDPTITTTIFGFLMLSRGIGNILSTPISTALQPAQSPAVSSTGSASRHEIGFNVAGGQYENVIVYAGTCFAVAATVIAAGWIVDRRYPSRAGNGRASESTGRQRVATHA